MAPPGPGWLVCVGEYSEYSTGYSPYSTTKPFTPILPIRTIFSPVLYLPARPGRMLYRPQPFNSICYSIGIHLGQSQDRWLTAEERFTAPPGFRNELRSRRARTEIQLPRSDTLSELPERGNRLYQDYLGYQLFRLRLAFKESKLLVTTLSYLILFKVYPFS